MPASYRLPTLKLTADLRRGISMGLQDQAREVCEASCALRAEARQTRIQARKLREQSRRWVDGRTRSA